MMKMRLRKFDNITKVVGEYGSPAAKEELEWLLKLARTNFAACYGTGTQGPDAHDSAVDRLYASVPAIDGGGDLISRICGWLYAQAKEKCTCCAPSFITGCDHMAETGDNHVATECTCRTGECPWTHNTGVFL